MVSSFLVIRKWLVWSVGKGNKLGFGERPMGQLWVYFKLSNNLVHTMKDKALFKIQQVVVF